MYITIYGWSISRWLNTAKRPPGAAAPLRLEGDALLGVTFELGVEVMIQARRTDGPSTGMGSDTAVELAIQGIRTTMGLQRGCSEAFVSTQESKRPPDLIPNGMHTIGWRVKNVATSVSAGHRPICGPGWT
jgi:hypothetical protein